MPNKTFQTRISLKYDTYQNWTTNNPVLLVGEIAITTVPTAQGSVSQVPAVMIKSGDGTSNYNDLPWASALAADVYPWAKASTKPVYQAAEIQGLEDFISGEIQDTNTKYQIVASGTNGIQLQSQDIGAGKWTNVGDPITITYTLAEGSANGTVSFNGVDVPVHGLGTAAYTDADAYDAAGAAASVQTALTGTTGDASTVLTLYGVKKYAQEQAAAAQTAAQGYADTQIGAAKTELIGTGDATATTIKGAVQEAQAYADQQISSQIGAVYKPAGSVAFANLPKTPSAANLGNVYNVTDAFEADTRFVTGEQGDSYPAGSNVAVVQIEEAYYFDVLAGTVDLSAYSTTVQMNSAISTAVNGAKTELIGSGSATSTTIKGAVTEANTYADGLNTAMDSRVDALETAIGEGGSVETQIQTAIQALDKADAAVSGQFVTQVVETDGIIAVTRAALTATDIPEIGQDKVTGLTAALAAKADTSSLAAIATSGNMQDLAQTAGDLMILNCGSSSVNV